MTICKGCGKAIVWGETPEGTRIPLDPRAPVYESAPQAGDTSDRHTVRRTVTAFVSHFATCPKANDFSAGRKVK